MALVDAGRPRRGLAHPPAAGVLAGVRRDGRRAGRPVRADRRAAKRGRGPDVLHGPQEPDGYHGPVAYLDDPYRRLERASSELEFALLLVFLKETARRA